MRLINSAEIAIVSGGTSNWVQVDGQDDCIGGVDDFGGMGSSQMIAPAVAGIIVAAIGAAATITVAVISYLKDSQPPKPTKTVTTVDTKKCEERLYGDTYCYVTNQTVTTVETK